MSIWKSSIKSPSDFTKHKEADYLLILGGSITALGDDYGPPDPPPRMETTYYPEIYALNKEQVENWVKDNQKSYRPKEYKILKIEPVEVKTEVTISF